MPHSRNRLFWNRTSKEYQQLHGQVLEETALAWGAWRIPESQVGALGDVRGRRCLELGCGGAQWSCGIALQGARAVGLDLSEAQLADAGARAARLSAPIALLQSDSELLPFADESFDIVFCDHGAMTFSDPERTVPEVARVLAPDGLFAFCMSTPIRDICSHPVTGAFTGTLDTDYFGIGLLDDGESVTTQLTYGDWIRLFRRCGFAIDDLIELQPPASATTTYKAFVTLDWARRWPGEHIWKVRKQRRTSA
jgi:SAM-dependent methyltransferase